MARMDYDKANRTQSVNRQGWIAVEKPAKAKKPKVGNSIYNHQVHHRAKLMSQGFHSAFDEWTKESDQELFNLKEGDELTYAELSDRIGRTVCSIKSRVKKLKKEGKWDECPKKHAPNDCSSEMHFITSIVNGIDPNTGERFLEDSSWLHPEIGKVILVFLRSQ